MFINRCRYFIGPLSGCCWVAAVNSTRAFVQRFYADLNNFSAGDEHPLHNCHRSLIFLRWSPVTSGVRLCSWELVLILCDNYSSLLTYCKTSKCLPRCYLKCKRLIDLMLFWFQIDHLSLHQYLLPNLSSKVTWWNDKHHLFRYRGYLYLIKSGITARIKR